MACCCSTYLHVCRSWRRFVFGSSHRIDHLQLVFAPATPAKDTVDAWPAWPLFIQGISSSISGVGNVVVAPLLRRRNSAGHSRSLMSGCAPRLRFLIPGIFHPRLDSHRPLYVDQPRNTFTSSQIQSPRSHPDWESLPPPPTTRSVLPTLKYFRFKAISEYLEDLATCIRVDAPRLNDLDGTFFNQNDVDTPLLAQFTSHTLTFKVLHETSAFFHDNPVFEFISVVALHPLVLLGHNTMLSQIGPALIVSLQSCPEIQRCW